MTKTTLLMALLLVACDPGVSRTEPEGPRVTATVGSAGGTFALAGGPSVTIPPGAIGSPTAFTVEETSEPTPAGAMTSIYRFGPENLVFGKPVTITFPVTGDASVYWSQLGNESVYDAISAGKPTAEVTYFTRGFAGLPCSGGSSCTPANPCHTGALACASGTPVCVDSGAALADLASCGNGKVCKAGACAVARPRTISGAFTTVYESDDGRRTIVPGVPPDNDYRLTAILIPSTAGYTSIPVTTGADWTFSVAGVPEGHYFLQLDQPTQVVNPDGTVADGYNRWLVEQTTNTPDLSSLVAAHPDARFPSRATPVFVNLTNLASSSRLRLVSRDPDVNESIPASGSFVWTSRLPDASRGDLTWLFQSVSSDGGARSSVVRYAALPLTIPDGGGSITAALQVAPQAQLRADLKLSQFDALSASVSPAATPDLAELEVRGLAHSATFPYRPLNTFAVHLGRLYPGNFTADTDYGTLPYGRFLDATWVENVAFWYEWLATLHDPDDPSRTVDTWPYYFATMPVNGAPASFAPALAPPSAPRISGKDAFVPRSGVGLAPTISWSAPSIGRPTSYTVSIDGGTANARNGDIFSLSATIYSGTSFVVPAGYLENDGRSYSATITASATPGDAIDTPVFGFSGNYATASCTIGLFKP